MTTALATIVRRFLPIPFFIGMVIGGLIVSNLLLWDRVLALHSQSFHGYLYTLNESGTWDRVRSNQNDPCRPRGCAVFFADNSPDLRLFPERAK